ncbi:MAG: hypothetical protein L6R40_003019 [Gallowayella cf. fulva]|nr:MAG: hypothetical protein L6R40_003019 [Xanthomendoza cf. fulva]
MDQAKLAKMQQSVRIGNTSEGRRLTIPQGKHHPTFLFLASPTLAGARRPFSATLHSGIIFLQRAWSSCNKADESPQYYSGKGTPRRKQKKVHKTSGTDDKKLQTSLKKLNVQPIQAIEEVNMFKEDGNVIHFAAPKVHAAVPSNTFAVYGNGEDKELTELVPGILNQLGPDSLASLRKLAESYQSLQKKDGGDENKDDDDDIPDLVAGENFESKVE